MKKLFLATILSCLALPGIHCQESEARITLSLAEAIDYALEHNKNLLNARQELVKSDKSVWEAISQGLPQANAALDYMTYFNYELEFQFGVDEDFSFSQDQLNEAATQTLAAFQGNPMAGLDPVTPQDLYNHSAGNYYDGVLQGMMPPSTILMQDVMTAKMEVSQLIFSGQYITGIQLAKLAKVISGQALDNSEIDTKEAVVNAYYLTLITASSLEMVEQNLDNLKKMLNQTKKLYESGMAELLDVDQFRVTVNQLENTRQAMVRNLEMNFNMLRFTLGLPAGTKIELTDDLQSLFDAEVAGELLLTDFNKDENITYRLMNTQAVMNKKMWNLEKWNYAPTIAGFYNYNFKLRTTGFDMTPEHLAGFNVSVPIFSSGMRHAKTTQARIDYEVAERNAEILSDQLDLQEDQLKYNLQSSLENYRTQLENVEVAERVLENYQRKYNQGMASSLDVTQANSNYLDAQSNFLNAKFEVMNARIQLEKLMNNLSSL